MALTKLNKYSVKNSKLTDKQRAFVNEYTKDYNGVRAAIAAGYSPKAAKVQATKLLKMPWVAKAIGHIEFQSQKQHTIDREEILTQLYYCATRSGADFVDDSGCLINNIKSLPERAQQAIDSIKQRKKQYTCEDGTVIQEVQTELRLVPKAHAIDLAMRHKGLFAAEKVETTVSVDTQLVKSFIQEMHKPLIIDIDPIEQKIQAITQHKEQTSE